MHPAIGDFADALYPDMPATLSAYDAVRQPTGVPALKPGALAAHRPTVLRHRISANTLGYGGINFRALKGSTFDHVVIFPTGISVPADERPCGVAPATEGSCWWPSPAHATASHS